MRSMVNEATAAFRCSRAWLVTTLGLLAWPLATLAMAPGVNGGVEATPAAIATPRPCNPTARKQWISVQLTSPAEKDVTAVTVLVDYPDHKLRIPGSKNDEKVKRRLGRLPAGALTGVNDLDSALRVVMARSSKLPAREIFTVEFDRCDGADRATEEDFVCVVEGAANSSGAVDGVTCTVKVP